MIQKIVNHTILMKEIESLIVIWGFGMLNYTCADIPDSWNSNGNTQFHCDQYSKIWAIDLQLWQDYYESLGLRRWKMWLHWQAFNWHCTPPLYFNEALFQSFSCNSTQCCQLPLWWRKKSSHILLAITINIFLCFIKDMLSTSMGHAIYRWDENVWDSPSRGRQVWVLRVSLALINLFFFFNCGRKSS